MSISEKSASNEADVTVARPTCFHLVTVENEAVGGKRYITPFYRDSVGGGISIEVQHEHELNKAGGSHSTGSARKVYSYS